MSDAERCSFCLRLPPLPRHRTGVAARCPVCHGALARTLDQTYRTEAGPPTVSGSNRVAFAAAGLVAAVVVAGVTVTLARTWRTALPAELTPVARVELSVPPPPVVDFAVPAPDELVSKPVPPAPPAASIQTQRVAPPTATTAATPRVAALAGRRAEPAESAKPAAPDSFVGLHTTRDLAPPWGSAGPDVKELLRRVPELSIHQPSTNGTVSRPDRTVWRDVERAVGEQKDKFVDELLAKRPDLAGLPFRKGAECRLAPVAARVLEDSSRAVRNVTARSTVGSSSAAVATDVAPYSSASFQTYYGLTKDAHVSNPGALPAVEQVLTGEAAGVRMGLVDYLRGRGDAAAVLARRAVFDASEPVRY